MTIISAISVMLWAWATPGTPALWINAPMVPTQIPAQIPAPQPSTPTPTTGLVGQETPPGNGSDPQVPNTKSSPGAGATQVTTKNSEQAQPSAASLDNDPQAKLKRARNSFAYGDYELAVTLLADLVLPGRLEHQQDLIDAQRMLGVAAIMTGRQHEAKRAFMDLLFLDPDTSLDPFLTPPPAVEFFESVAHEMRDKLQALREQRNNTKPPEKVTPTVTVIEQSLRRHSRLAIFVPLGFAQFDRQAWAMGALFLGTQAISLGVVVTTALIDDSLRNSGGYLPEADLPLHQALRWTNWIAMGSAIAFYALGVSEAWFAFRGETLESQRRIEVPVDSPKLISPEARKAPQPTDPTAVPTTSPQEP